MTRFAHRGYRNNRYACPYKVRPAHLSEGNNRVAAKSAKSYYGDMNQSPPPGGQAADEIASILALGILRLKQKRAARKPANSNQSGLAHDPETLSPVNDA